MADMIDRINDYLVIILIVTLCGSGLFFTLRLRFVQIRKLPAGFKAAFGGFASGDQADEEGMSSFQSLATAIAAQVGTGNIAGAATAIVSGGPGAIFWMWVSAFLGMGTAFAEATLAQRFRTRRDGEIVGGPVYYIREAFAGWPGRVLAAVFALLVVLALGFMGNMVQSNSLSAAFSSAFGVPPLLVGGITAILAFLVFQGGVQRIAAVVEKMVPVMALIYIAAALYVIVCHDAHILPAFLSIIQGALHPEAVLGGAAGIGVKEAIRYGVARGLFSNEAGMGSSPHAHALAKVKHPCQQGLVAVIGVFIDTFVILNVTAFAILVADVSDGATTGIELAQQAFATTFGAYGAPLIAVCLSFFVFSTFLGWYFFGELNVKYLFGRKAVGIYSFLVAVAIIAGSALKVDIVWALADLFNSLMVVPNMLALLALSGTVLTLNDEFERRHRS